MGQSIGLSIKAATNKGNATIAQMQNAFGWQPYTARAAVPGLRKGGAIVERSEGSSGSRCSSHRFSTR